MFLIKKKTEPERWQHCAKKLPPWDVPVLFCIDADADEPGDESSIPKEMFAGVMTLVTSSKSGTTLKISTIAGEADHNAEYIWWAEQPQPRRKKGGLQP